MKNGYLGRLIARAASVPPRASSSAAVADPFETTEPMPVALPPPSFSTFAPVTLRGPRDEPSLEASPQFERTVLQPAETIEHTTFIEHAPVVEPAMEAAPSAIAMPTVTPHAVVQWPEEGERAIEDHERPIVPVAAQILPRGPESAIEALQQIVSETVVDRETTTRVVEREVTSLQPNNPQPVTAALAAPIETPATMVQPQAAPVLETIRVPAETTSLSIGRLIVDVVPTPRAAAAPKSNRGTRRASRVPSSASHFFGLGQI
jgi:hypothetical protein